MTENRYDLLLVVILCAVMGPFMVPRLTTIIMHWITRNCVVKHGQVWRNHRENYCVWLNSDGTVSCGSGLHSDVMTMKGFMEFRNREKLWLAESVFAKNW